MDAGLAAVLGATVGAIGTGGAALATSLLNRSQARLQLLVEHERFLREPRRDAYVAYAESISKINDLITAIRGTMLRIPRTGSQEERQEFLDQISRKLEEVSDLDDGNHRLMTTVFIEGPEVMQNYATSVGGSCTVTLAALRRWLADVFADRESTQSHAALEGAHNELGARYAKFLGAASESLDGKSTHPLR
ncbi:hypothetical protein ACGFXB_27540 [Streptomyces canus]|uniref:hypothetical protein n=1 Tax=Streptomyces canus TaxID=58343 RepID=UPI003719B7AD